MKATRTRRRSAWVWFISIFYVISAGYALLCLYLVNAGLIPLTPAQEAYFDGLSPLDRTMALVIGSGNLLGAVNLFFLRKESFYLFSCTLAGGILLGSWRILAADFPSALGSAGSLKTLLGWAISISVVVYSRKLMKKGILA